MAGLETIALVASIAGAVTSGVGTIMAGNAAAAAGEANQRAYNLKSEQATIAAEEARAASQRTQQESKRKTDLVQSRLRAVAAAGGGSSDDPTIVHLNEDIAGRGEFQQLMDMYTGENRARGFEDQSKFDLMSGEASRAEGEGKQTASYLSGVGTIMSSGSSIYSKAKGLYA